MISQAQIKDEKLIEEVWGECCLECECSSKPNLRYYNLKSENIAILSCTKCEFTIVVIELDRLYDENLKEELETKDNDLIATYPM